MSNMKLSPKGYCEIALYEGWCPRVYFDTVGVKTFGFGNTVSDIPYLNTWDMALEHSLEEGINIFKLALIKYVSAVNKSLKIDILQHQFDAIISVTYNIGISGEEHSTFIKFINEAKNNKDIKDAIMMWNKPSEIIGRREKECNLYLTGEYSNNGYVESLNTDSKGHQLKHTAKQIFIEDKF